MSCSSLTLCTTALEMPVQRRSANYPPSQWKDDQILSLKNTYEGNHGSEDHEELKENVKRMIEGCEEPLAQMDLVDNLQRLGISYHFEKEIKVVMDSIFTDNKEYEDLHAAALRFRLSRQLGYRVSTDVFKVFVDESGKFKNILAEDVKGLLSLYEASHLGFEGEDILEEATSFSTYHLQESITKTSNLDSSLARQIAYALELPLSRRMVRWEARNYIDIYESMPGHHSALLNLAKLDFNIVQSLYHTEVKEMLRWWRDLQLAEKLKFGRDRLIECYLWSVGTSFNPRFSVCRKGVTKICLVFTIIDDMYDVYGTIEELELFTQAVDKWDIRSIDELPPYMRLCFLALYNTVNQFSYDFMRDKQSNILVHLTKSVADLCNAYMVEARWFYEGHTPTVEEYLDNGWISSVGPLILVHAYFFVQHDLKEDAATGLHHYFNLIRSSSIAMRLHDDLMTVKDEMVRGDVAKCMECYMKEKGVSVEAARHHVNGLLKNAWKQLHKECVEAISDGHGHPILDCALNFAKMAQFVYQYGDGHGFSQRDYSDERVRRLMFESV